MRAHSRRIDTALLQIEAFDAKPNIELVKAHSNHKPIGIALDRDD